MRTKKLPALLSLLLCSGAASAQFTSGDNFFMSSGATVSIHGLVLNPTFNTTWNDIEITPSNTAIAGSPTNSIKRVYFFNNPTPYAGNISIQYDPSELNGNSEADLRIAYYNPQEGFVTTVQGNVDMANHLVSHDFSMQNLLKVTAGNSNAKFPVLLKSFFVSKSEQQTLLTWSTAIEANADFFEIQRSAEGKQWLPLGTVKAEGENQPSSYTFTDINPLTGDNLYRLKMVDYDGTFSYSRIASVHFGGEKLANVYPNPVSEKLIMRYDDWNSVKALKVYNSNGKAVYDLNQAKSENQAEKSFNFRDLPAGLYIINTTATDGTTQSEKVIKR